MTNKTRELLENLFSGGKVTNADQLALKKELKPVFYTNSGFMDWARSEVREQTKTAILDEANLFLEDKAKTSDDLIEEFSQIASELNQGAQLNLFFNLLTLFPNFEGANLSLESKGLLHDLQSNLASLDLAKRDRAAMMISMFAEMSNSQSRKSSAGAVAEQAVELVLRNAGLEKGTGYGTQFVYQGSNTDFVVPYAASGQVDDVRAFIAVQLSTNDRARLSSSELHKGAKRYLCSLNGCSASSKSTTDIGDDLAAGYLNSETYYVVIEKERLKALEDARRRLKTSTDKPKEKNVKRRIRWLEEFGINYDEFVRQLKMMS